MHRSPLMTVLVAAMLVTSACGDGTSVGLVEPSGNASGSAPISVVVDYSPTISDVAALLYLTQHPEVELLGVTLAGTGESHCDTGVSNTTALLAIGGMGPLPVACGPEQPVGPGHEWPPAWRVASDQLVGLSLPATDTPRSEDAVDLLARLAAEAPEPITIVALGPLTNLALALKRHPQFADDVSMIYTMGGAFDVDGNAPGGHAEWNYYIDPTSVDVVLRSGIAITMVPLDATDRVPMTEAWFRSLSEHHTTAAAGAVLELHTEARPFELGFFFWDELAAAVAIDESLVTLMERSVSIDTGGESSCRTRDDPNGADVRVAVNADRSRFETALLTGLNAGAVSSAAQFLTGNGEPDAATLAYFESVAESAGQMSAGLELLFMMPEAAVLVEIGDDPDPVLGPGQEEMIRVFMRAFWSGATDLMQDHHDVLASAEVPEKVADAHDDMLSATDALIATRDERLFMIDDLAGEELVGFLWTPNPELDEFERACSTLQAAAHASSVTARVCPD